MTSMIEERTLAWVNRVRGSMGAKKLNDLPKGIRRSKEDCPLAKAFQDIAPMRVSNDYIGHHGRKPGFCH